MSAEALEADIQKDAWAEKGWWNAQVFFISIIIGSIVGFIVSFAFNLNSIENENPIENELHSYPWLIAGMVGTSIVIYFVLIAAANRRLAIEKWCQEHNWNFKQGILRSVEEIGFRKGHASLGAIVKNLGMTTDYMWKKVDDRTVLLASSQIDSRHPGGSQVAGSLNSNSSQNCILLVYLLMEIDTPAPEVIVHRRRENAFVNMMFSRGEVKTVKFELDEFNKEWTVRSDDAKGAYDLLDQSTMEFIMGLKGNLIIEFHEGVMAIICVHGQGMAARKNLMEIGEGFSRAVPDDLVKPVDLI